MATMEPIDTLAAIRVYLTHVDQIALTNILTDATYIFGPPGIPDSLVSSMPCKCITYLQSGGLPRGFQTPLTVARLEFRCYGLTHIEASAVERKLALVLDKHNNEAVGSNCIFSARKATEAQFLVEMDTEWPYVWIPYELVFSQVVTD